MNSTNSLKVTKLIKYRLGCMYTFDTVWIREIQNNIKLVHSGKRTVPRNPQITMTFMPMISVCKPLTTTVYTHKLWKREHLKPTSPRKKAHNINTHASGTFRALRRTFNYWWGHVLCTFIEAKGVSGGLDSAFLCPLLFLSASVSTVSVCW